MESEWQHFLCEERYGKVITIKYGSHSERISRFLKPCASSFSEAERVSSRAPLAFEVFSTGNKTWPLSVDFRGWARQQKNLNNWVESLAPEYCALWIQAGICDAIMSSCYEISSNKEIVLGLAEFWCPETNTFVFPWGEATITLEDVMILGGFSVRGDSVTKPVSSSEMEMAVNAMRDTKSAMCKGRSKKASPTAWMKHFMENHCEFEHEGFLSLWLSKFVFSSRAKDTISSDVFPIAAHLSKGTQMALAPAVLAGLYKNLSLLKEQAIASSSSVEITVFAPFQLVLMWAFEHFPQLVHKPPNELKPGEPRAARWQKLNFKISSSVIRTVFSSLNCFEWRPFAAEISNWNHSSFYSVTKHLTFDSEKNSDEVLQSYAICLQMSYLVGMNCKERYMPHRVAMQFGMDQDLPGEFSALDLGLADFFVPPRSFEPGVSARYFDWWQKSEFSCKGTLPNISRINTYSFQYPAAEGEMNTEKNLTPSVPKAKQVRDDEPKFDELNDNFYIIIKSEDGSLERSPSIEEVTSGVDCYAAESFGSKSPKILTQRSAMVECDASITRKFALTRRLQDHFEADHVAVAKSFKQMANDSKDLDDVIKSERGSSPISDEDKLCLSQLNKKRSFSVTTDGVSDFKATISATDGEIDTDKMRIEAVDSAKHLKIAVKEGDKHDTNRFIMATMDLERRNSGNGDQNVREESVQDVSEECKESMAELSFNSAMNVDNNGFLGRQIFFYYCDLERRIQRLEKRLGVSP